jgi:homoserine dehydrogenase
MKTINLALVGFGNVGQAFLRLLMRKENRLKEEFDFECKVTGIATGTHGSVIDPQGIDFTRALEIAAQHGNLSNLAGLPARSSTMDFIRTCPADVLLENSPVNHQTGQPAADHLRTALECGMHAITANKGPVVHAFKDLTSLAVQRGKRFLFESAVMDGAPIFSLFRGSLPAIELQGFSGILNSCTNFLLGRMEAGVSFDQAIEEGRAIGITETDPSADIDGWDAAIKVAALCTVLMGVPLKPQQVDRIGIHGITPTMINEALTQNERWKLVCRARREQGGVSASVAPARVKSSSPLYAINGTSSFVQFESDVLPALGILETNPGPETTAYGLLCDLINAIRGA